MKQQDSCPNCNKDIEFVEQINKWFCNNCNAIYDDISQKKGEEIKSQTIFLSYGHDDNFPLIKKIKEDLEARGHTVWIDFEGIKEGNEWRSVITENIQKSNQVLAVLSKHSTREPGVCLDEINIALAMKDGVIHTILVEPEEIVQTPNSISHIQWVDMQNWKKQYEEDKKWDDFHWYNTQLKKIISLVENEEHTSFSGEIQRLKEIFGKIGVTPENMIVKTYLKKKFYGRKHIYIEIANWVSDRNSPILFWLKGAPGIGKSALVANLTHVPRSPIVASHYCNYKTPNMNTPEAVITHIALQIACRLPSYRKFLLQNENVKYGKLKDMSADELFLSLLITPLNSIIDGNHANQLIVIDALDEATVQKENEIAVLLAKYASQLPLWIKVLVTSRPEVEVVSCLQDIEALDHLVLASDVEENQEDILIFFSDKLRDLLPLKRQNEILQILFDKSEGVFLYADLLCSSILNKNRRGKSGNGNILLTIEEAMQFPQGLSDFYSLEIERIVDNMNIRNIHPSVYFEDKLQPAIEIILASREAMNIDFLQDCLSLNNYEIQYLLNGIHSLFPVSVKENCKVITPYHKSISDWICNSSLNHLFFVDIYEGEKKITDYLIKHYQEKNDIPEYGKKFMITHLLTCEKWDEILWLGNIFFDFDKTVLTESELDLILNHKTNTEKELEFILRLWIQLGDAYNDQGKLVVSHKIADFALNKNKIACEEFRDNQELKRKCAVLYGRCGSVYEKKGEVDKAIKLYNVEIELFKKLIVVFPENDNLKRSLASSYIRSGGILEDKGEMDKALGLYVIVSKIFTDLHEDNPDDGRFQEGLAIAFERLGGICEKKGDLDEALKYYNLEKELFVELNQKNLDYESATSKGLVVVYDKIGGVYEKKGKIKLALKLYQQGTQRSNELYRRNTDNESLKNNLAVSYERLGILYESIGEIDKALEFYLKRNKLSLELYKVNPESESLKNGLAISYSKIGGIYEKQNLLDKALVFYLRKNELSSELYEANSLSENLKNGLAISYSKLGGIYEKKREINRALAVYKKRNILNHELFKNNPQNENLKNGLAISLEKLGGIYEKKGNVNEALKFYKKRNELGQELHEANPENINLFSGLAASLFKLGMIYMKLNHKQESFESFTKSADIYSNLYAKTNIKKYSYKEDSIRHILGRIEKNQ